MENGDTIYNYIKGSKRSYSEQEVRKCIIILRKCNSPKVCEKYKNNIMLLCSKILIRNIDYFFNSIRSIEQHHIVHEKDDMVSESILILNKCVERFDISVEEYRFYFFFNSALQKGFRKIKDESYCDKSNKHTYIQVEDILGTEQTTQPIHPFLLNKNFSKKEILLINSKIDDESVGNFCKKLSITKSEYYKILKSVLEKVNKKYFLD